MGILLYAWVPIDGGKSFFKGCIKAFAILSNIFESQLINDFIWKSKTLLFYPLTKLLKSKSVFMLIFLKDKLIKLILNNQNCIILLSFKRRLSIAFSKVN